MIYINAIMLRHGSYNVVLHFVRSAVMKKWKVIKKRQDVESKEENNVEKQTSDLGAKKRKKHLFLPIITVVLVCAVALVWALPQLPIKPQQQAPETYKGVLELWNVEAIDKNVIVIAFNGRKRTL